MDKQRNSYYSIRVKLTKNIRKAIIMTLKDLKTLSRHFPRSAKLQLKIDDKVYDNFTLELKYNSEEEWLAIMSVDDPQRPNNK